jgi:NifU-like protein involved in Fe-S cluster formation
MAMDEAVRLKYRELVRTGFHYAEKIENPTIFLNTLEEGIRLCSASTNGFMNIFIEVKDAVVEKARYMCSCDPTANVVVETMCGLIEGKTLEQVKAISGEDYYQAVGSSGEALVERVRSIIELINRGIDKYLTKTGIESDNVYCG